MSGHLISRAGFALVVAALAHSGARAQSAADFFRGQTLRVVIPSAPGGGRVFYSLPFVEFFGRHLPGKPNVQPVFMPGAGAPEFSTPMRKCFWSGFGECGRARTIVFSVLKDSLKLVLRSFMAIS